MYTFVIVDVVHIPTSCIVQRYTTITEDTPKKQRSTTVSRSERRLPTLKLHFVRGFSKPKLKRVFTFYSPKLLGYSLRDNSKLKGCANNPKVKH